MRLQDELVALYSIADAPTRRYILGQVPRLPVHFDAAELAALLERGLTDPDRLVAARAAAAWDRGGPRLILHGYGLDPGRMGVWSTLAAQVAGETPAPLDTAEVDSGAQRAALAQVLEPCRAALIALAARPGLAGEHARQALGLVPFAGVDDVLMDGARDPARATGALLALARRDGKLALATAKDLGRLPAWVRAIVAGAVGGKAGLAAAVDAARTGDANACWLAAEALPELANEAWPDLAQACQRQRGGWAPVVLADALGQLAPRPEALKVLDELLKSASHDLARILAIRAMGGFPGDLAVKRALKCLDRGSPLLQAAAVECLARLDHRAPELPPMLAARAKQGPLKLRGTAILGLMVFDTKAALKLAVELVNARDPASRVEGAYALGYLKSPHALALLNLLARKDPFVPSALQAEKSLAHFPEAQAAPGLIELLAHREPEVALASLRVLSHYPGEAQGAVLPALEKLEKSAVGPAALSECGLLGPSVAGVTEFLSRPRADGAARAAALEGLVRSGEVSPELARAAAGDADPALSVTGALAQLVAGDADGAAALAKRLADGASEAAAVRAVRDLAVIAGEAGRGGRHSRLARLLTRRTTGRMTALKSASRAVPKPAPAPAEPALRAVEEVPSVEAKQALDGLASNLQQVSKEPAKRDWPKELTYLHGPSSFFETYKALMPAVVIVGAIVLFFVGQTARHALSSELSPVVARDQVIGKVGSVVELSGKITELLPERSSILVAKDKAVTVRVWMPGQDVKALKVGAEVTVRGTVKDLRANPIVVHGFTIKD